MNFHFHLPLPNPELLSALLAAWTAVGVALALKLLMDAIGPRD